MVAVQFIKAKVSDDVKARVRGAAERELLTESLWLRRLVDAALCDARPPRDTASPGSLGGSPSDGGHRGQRRVAASAARMRLNVRLRHDDRLILQERAEARGMPAATYVATLVRVHLRALAPLPREELAGLKRSIAELGSIGRNLNQIARVAHQSGRITGPDRDDLRSMLKICEAMREHIKTLVRANVASWENGHAETGH